jgi:hypothetical protein
MLHPDPQPIATSMTTIPMNATLTSSFTPSLPRTGHPRSVFDPRRWTGFLTGLLGLIGSLGLAPLEGGPLDGRGDAVGRPKSGQGNLPQVSI